MTTTTEILAAVAITVSATTFSLVVIANAPAEAPSSLAALVEPAR